MKLARRYQILPAYSYCRRHGCAWTDTGSRAPETVEHEAAAHTAATGHETRAVTAREVIITPARAVTRA